MGIRANATAGAHALPMLIGARVVLAGRQLELLNHRARELEELGYRPQVVERPTELREADAVVLEPGDRGWIPQLEVARWREATRAPLLVIGAAGTLAEMAAAYEAGADEYCAPNASTVEVDLRLRALFRRLEGPPHPASGEEVVRVGELEIDPRSQTVRKRGRIVPLSPTEFRLLLALAERPGQVIPARALVSRVWGTQYADETQYLRLYIRYLRQKLEDDPSNPRYIVNRWGAGYALTDPRRAA